MVPDPDLSYAKVNLHLEVVGKRPDGTHELLTLFERIDLADTVTVEWTDASLGVEVRCEHPEVPTDRSNLAARAASDYLAASGLSRGVRITIDKKIPVGAGLGGGSSNAAAALKALQKLSGSRLPEDRLLELAKGLGADVPFFLSDFPYALGRGRGDEIEALESKTPLWHLLVFPRFSVPTRSVYQAFGLTPPAPDVRLLVCALRENRAAQVRHHLFNALEPTVEALYPAIRDVKAAMAEKGGLAQVLVSGSGSTVFAVCAGRPEAEQAYQRLKDAALGWDLVICSTAL